MGHTLSWEKGRQLKSYDNIRFTYNANGIRTSKTVNGIKHTYTLDGTKILRETWGTNVLIPLYDNEDSVCGIIFNDTPYYFQKNLQGDIIAIADCNAKVVAKYSYDAWGKCSITCDSSCDCDCIAEINPFRYRGYYYDRETEFYYLQSRYYDPELGRFVNGDEILFSLFSVNTADHDLWAYCINDPVNLSDPSGHFSGVGELAVSFIALCVALLALLALYSWMSFSEFKNSWSNFCIKEKNGFASITSIIIACSIATVLNWCKTKIKAAIAAIKAYTTIVRADAKIRNTVKKKSKSRYWTATLKTDYVDIGRSISYATAVTEVSRGRNIFTVTKAEAKAVAKAAYSNKKPVGPEIDKGKENVIGYYYHFHVYDRKKKGHVFFLYW